MAKLSTNKEIQYAVDEVFTSWRTANLLGDDESIKRTARAVKVLEEAGFHVILGQNACHVKVMRKEEE